MKFNLLLVATLLCFLFITDAQGQKTKIRVGLELGPNYASLRFPFIFENSSLISPDFGFSVGGTVQIPITSFLSLRSGLSFERKAFKINPRFGPPNETLPHGWKNYLILPVITQFSVGKPGKNKFLFQLGYYGGYVLSYKYVDPLLPNSNNINEKPNYRFDAGLVLGLGYNIPLKNNKTITIGWRNNIGLIQSNRGDRLFFINDRTFSSILLLGIGWE